MHICLSIVNYLFIWFSITLMHLKWISVLDFLFKTYVYNFWYHSHQWSLKETSSLTRQITSSSEKICCSWPYKIVVLYHHSHVLYLDKKLGIFIEKNRALSEKQKTKVWRNKLAHFFYIFCKINNIVFEDGLGNKYEIQGNKVMELKMKADKDMYLAKCIADCDNYTDLKPHNINVWTA